MLENPHVFVSRTNISRLIYVVKSEIFRVITRNYQSIIMNKRAADIPSEREIAIILIGYP